MKFSPEQRQRMAKAFNGGLQYGTVSKILTWTTTVLYLGVFLVFLFWRHDQFIARACRVGNLDYSRSEFCLVSRGPLGWMAAGFEAVLPTALVMLILIGLVYWLFGRRLGMRHDWGSSDRRDTVGILAAVTAGAGLLVLVIFGMVALFVS